MYVCMLDQHGELLLHRNMPASPETFLKAIAPYRDDLVVAVECIFTWYWLADLCTREGIAFVLGHALYMKAVHGGKAKNDRIDAGKIARLLKGGNFPLAYAYPKGMRETRDLLRRRTYLVRLDWPPARLGIWRAGSVSDRRNGANARRKRDRNTRPCFEAASTPSWILTGPLHGARAIGFEGPA